MPSGAPLHSAAYYYAIKVRGRRDGIPARNKTNSGGSLSRRNEYVLKRDQNSKLSKEPLMLVISA